MPTRTTMFSPTTPVLEIVLRGTILYLTVVVMMRVIGQRESGGLRSPTCWW